VLTVVLVALPVALLVLGLPIFLILLTTSITVVLFFVDVPTTIIHQQMFGAIDKYALLAVPFFIFAGEIMGRGGVSRRVSPASTRFSSPWSSIATFRSASGSTPPPSRST
jgi:C4-dicarboxylate transporter DctM subunit